MQFKRVIGTICVAAAMLLAAGEARPQLFGAFGVSSDSQPPLTAFDPARTPPAPNYAERSEWVSLPDMRDPADDAPPKRRYRRYR